MPQQNDLTVARDIATKVERFVRDVAIPYESVNRHDTHGPDDALVAELREKARLAGLLTPHIGKDGVHLSHRGTALVLRAAGLSTLGPLAVNVAPPDEGNMFLLGRVATESQKRHFLQPLIEGRVRSAFMMTEPAAEGGAGSDPSMLRTLARQDGDHWVINGRKAFITGFVGASKAILMARTGEGPTVAATMFLIDLPNPSIRVERVLNTIDSGSPGGHAVLTIQDLRVPAEHVLGGPHEGFAYAQVRLAPARLTHCMRWLGAAIRANEIATRYATARHGFGKPLIDHEGIGFMLVDNMIDLKQCELMIDWCADALDGGSAAITESSMTKVAVSESLYRVLDRCVQMMGGTGVSGDTVVEHIFREIRCFRIYDGPTEVHKWSLAKKIKKAGLSV